MIRQGEKVDKTRMRLDQMRKIKLETPRRLDTNNALYGSSHIYLLYVCVNTIIYEEYETWSLLQNILISLQSIIVGVCV